MYLICLLHKVQIIFLSSDNNYPIIPNTIEKIRTIVDSFQSSGAVFPTSVEVIGDFRFIDIGEIVDHQCLNFLFFTQ